MLYYGIALIVLVLDQLTKWLVRSNMDLGQSISVIGDFFQITSHRNRGAAFGILQDQRWFFIIVTTVVVVGLVLYMQKMIKEADKKLLPFALSLILGGAIGNFIDRLVSGEVTDFFHFHFVFDFFGSHVDYEFAIFNVADCGIVVGVILVLVDALFGWNNERKARGASNEQ